jgi:uncharacterized protein YecT (DUF1311 family)
MKKIYILFIVLFFSQNVLLKAQTQTDLNMEASAELKKAEAEMSLVFNKILKIYSEDKVFIANLKKSQQAWFEFRSIELQVMFPERDPGYYGSVHSMCLSNYLVQLTNERTKKLTNWIIGTVEGDACSGSLKWDN